MLPVFVMFPIFPKDFPSEFVYIIKPNMKDCELMVPIYVYVYF